MKDLGFTLIEIMVAITILLIVTGIAVGGFITFQDRRTVEENAKKLQQVFIAARNKAQVKETPASCVLQGYRVQYDSGARTVTLRPLCGPNPNPITNQPTSLTAQAALDSYTLIFPAGTALQLNGTNMGSGTVIDFYTLERGTNGTGQGIFTLQSGTTEYGFRVVRGILGGSVSNVEENPT